MFRVIRTRKHIAHVLAHCTKCNFEEQLYTKAARAASAHTKRTGHRVKVEVGVFYDTVAFPKPINE